jgi:hypothetical protein
VTVLDRVPIDQITAEAQQVNVGRTLLKLIGGLFYLIGWVAAKLIVGVVWCCVAVKTGYVEAGGPRKTPRRVQRGLPG